MRAVIQRVSRASVTVDGSEAASIGPGLMVLLGVAATDSPADAAWTAGKIARLRVFADDRGMMNRSVGDVGGEVLLVSQFTLLGDARKGNRPSFTAAAGPEPAERLYTEVAEEVRREGIAVRTGVFGATMQVEIINDGPVTIILESDGGKETRKTR
ncbi:MAG: D-aminoacyl-tRNA deacylase [Pseudomonadota bacterium]